MTTQQKVKNFLTSRGFNMEGNIGDDMILYQQYWCGQCTHLGVDDNIVVKIRFLIVNKNIIQSCTLWTDTLPRSKRVTIRGKYKWITLLDDAIDVVKKLHVIRSKMTDAKQVKIAAECILNQYNIDHTL